MNEWTEHQIEGIIKRGLVSCIMCAEKSPLAIARPHSEALEEERGQASRKRATARPQPSAWEIYSELAGKLDFAPPGSNRDRARNVSRLFRELLVAKRQARTL